MNSLSDLLRRHRSIRQYKPDPISAEIVEQVCGDAIAGSSSSGNLNSVSVVLTRDNFDNLHSMTEIAEFLDLPDTCLPVTTIVVGHPAEDPPKRDRLPLAAFLHDETYRRPAVAELERAYEQREVKGWARYMAYPEAKLRALLEAKHFLP